MNVYIEYSRPIYKIGTNSKDTLKIARKDLKLLGQECKLITEEELEEKGKLVKKYFHDIEKEAIRRVVLDERARLDGIPGSAQLPASRWADRCTRAHFSGGRQELSISR